MMKQRKRAPWYNSQTRLVSILVLLDLSAAFDTIDHTILLQRLEHLVGIKGLALSWFKSYFSERSQFVNINDESSKYAKVSHGVPQGSVLGPILFSLYMLPLGNIIRKHSINFHCYLAKLQACIKDIKSWMTHNFLMLNSDKTEVIVLGPKHLRTSRTKKRDHISPVLFSPRSPYVSSSPRISPWNRVAPRPGSWVQLSLWTYYTLLRSAIPRSAQLRPAASNHVHPGCCAALHPITPCCALL
uniref:Reverse transcriptase domain-containing protein n=1 Tax=Sander lucioperca TaxID=283035 RepID=A0A8C9XXU8_SANLU